jgi:hypothetical protein
MTRLDLDEPERKARAIAEWDEEFDADGQQCVACRSAMHIPTDLDPTPLCNGCAQAYAVETAPVTLALIARIRELEATVETMKAEVWEANEDNFKCGQIAAEQGCLVANAPSDAVRTLANRYVEATGRAEKLEAIARAAAAFIDEQGKHLDEHDELEHPAAFATSQYQDLVRAVEGDGR